MTIGIIALVVTIILNVRKNNKMIKNNLTEGSEKSQTKAYQNLNTPRPPAPPPMTTGRKFTLTEMEQCFKDSRLVNVNEPIYKSFADYLKLLNN